LPWRSLPQVVRYAAASAAALSADHSTPSPNAHLPAALIVCYVLCCGIFSHTERSREESGMEKLLNSLSGTIIAGFVLVIVEILVIHAIH
jgi:hypothetical protein